MPCTDAPGLDNLALSGYKEGMGMSTKPLAIDAPDTTGDRDPVCGMTVQAESPHQTTFAGTTYRFCSAGCLAKFKAAPQRSGAVKAVGPADAPRPAPAASEYTCPMHPEVRRSGPGACPKCGMALEPVHISSPAGKVEWTCPMHPQIARDAPGSCPICGMALEPRTVRLGAEENPELVDMRRRFWVALALTALLILMMLGEFLPGQPLHRLLPMPAVNWIELILATPVVLGCGWPFLVRFWQSLIHRSPNMFTLIGLGVTVAYTYSLAAVLAPSIFPASFRDASGSVGTYFEVAAVIVTLVLLGQVLELQARSQTSAAI